MGIPKSVKQQASMADQLREQWYGSREQDQAEEAQPQQQPEAPAQPEPAAQPQQEEKRGEDYWEQRFKVLQGKYNAEIKSVEQKNSELEERLKEQEQKLQELEAAKPFDVSQHFTPEQVENFGEDSLALIHKHAEHIASTKLQQQEQRLSEEMKQLRQAQEQDRKNRFYEQIAVAVPDWQQINDDRQFHNWLFETVDVVTPQGRQTLTRQSLLEQYEASANAREVIAMFNEYKGSQDKRQRTEAPPRAAHQPSTSGAKASDADLAAFYATEYVEGMKRDPKGTLAREQALLSARY